jgi:hypothetical protein
LVLDLYKAERSLDGRGGWRFAYASKLPKKISDPSATTPECAAEYSADP